MSAGTITTGQLAEALGCDASTISRKAAEAIRYDAAAAEAAALCRPLICGGQGRTDGEAEEAGWLLLGGLIGMAVTVAAWGAWAVLS